MKSTKEWVRNFVSLVFFVVHCIPRFAVLKKSLPLAKASR